MKTSEFDYELPPELIAQQPPPRRDQARMMVVNRGDSTINHASIGDLPGLLSARDTVVLNKSRVIPARLLGKKALTGGKVELLLLEKAGNDDEWLALYKGAGRTRIGADLVFAGGRISATITDIREDDGVVTVKMDSREPLVDILEDEGLPPLPPYIKRPKGPSPQDKERYQTVYASEPGSVAAPTAGLHLTDELLAQIEKKGANLAFVTLHVGLGTFRPVDSELVEEHRMESERYEVGKEAAATINGVRMAGGRVVAVGTTTTRVLESVTTVEGRVRAASGRTELFITGGFRFRAVDVLLTNFHLPRSTLIMLVCAFAGHDLVMAAYGEAIRTRYRFYSYGDCMLIT